MNDFEEAKDPPVQVNLASCATFERFFNGCDIAEELVHGGRIHWFTDLLSLWRPAGEPTREFGLRLAVRGGYLNFYRRGQSIARVEVAHGRLQGYVHTKYLSEEARSQGGQVYGRFEGTSVATKSGKVAYDGVDTLKQWIKVIDKDYAGEEKELVDDLVSANDNVIDLEMALPSFLSRKHAVRIDLVSIEDRNIVFWEAKCAGDKRIRCRDTAAAPEVMDQLRQYKDFLFQDVHRARIADAYRNAAKVLVRLRAIADQLDKPRPLGAAIIEAQHLENLEVSRDAALVVIDENALSHDASLGSKWLSWHGNGHAAKLSRLAKVVAQARPGPLRLGDAL